MPWAPAVGLEGADMARYLAYLGRAFVLEFRLVREEDSLLLWEWANEPETRRWSFRSELIGLAEHLSWFSKSLADPNCLMLLFEKEGQPVGQVRFNLVQDSWAEVHISVERSSRGRGFGEEMLRKACAYAFQLWPITEVRAYVKTRNTRSLRVFEKAHFLNQGQVPQYRSRCLELVLPKKG